MSNLPVLREIFSGAAQFADDPAELAANLMAGLTDPDPGAREAGRALAARYTWSTAAQRHLELYHLYNVGSLPASLPLSPGRTARRCPGFLTDHHGPAV